MINSSRSADAVERSSLFSAEPERQMVFQATVAITSTSNRNFGLREPGDLDPGRGGRQAVAGIGFGSDAAPSAMKRADPS
jgi:hypothetical protein